MSVVVAKSSSTMTTASVRLGCCPADRGLNVDDDCPWGAIIWGADEEGEAVPLDTLPEDEEEEHCILDDDADEDELFRETRIARFKSFNADRK